MSGRVLPIPFKLLTALPRLARFRTKKWKIGKNTHKQTNKIPEPGQSAPADAVGVVGAAHGVEVELLEDLDVLHHPRLRDSLAPPLVVLVAASALDQDGFVVDQQLALLDLTSPEAHLHQRYKKWYKAFGTRFKGCDALLMRWFASVGHKRQPH